LQKILFKNSHMKKWKKTKKDSHSFCKVIPLAPLCVHAPINHLVIPHFSNDIIVGCNFKMDILWTIYLPKLIHLSCNTFYYKNIVPYINWCAQIYKFTKIFICFNPWRSWVNGDVRHTHALGWNFNTISLMVVWNT
jgi:hypothetical protein